MTRSVPQLVSLGAVGIGVVLFAVTLLYLDLDRELENVRRLGLAFPAILVPSTCWQLLRTWGWSVAFPDDSRPAFTRLFRVRLAADAISFLTVRGLTGDPLKVVLLYDRAPPAVTAAAVALERMAFAVIAILVAGLVSYVAVRQLAMPAAWDTLFSVLALVALTTVVVLVPMARRRTGHYLSRFVARVERVTGRPVGRSRAVRFVLQVEGVLLELLRGDRRRLAILAVLPIVCYGVMAFEVWIVLWALGEPIGVLAALAIETFVRLGSVASAWIPANLGGLEAANVAPVAMLGLGGGGALAIARRVRALLWAALGLALYPRVTTRAPNPQPHVPDSRV